MEGSPRWLDRFSSVASGIAHSEFVESAALWFRNSKYHPQSASKQRGESAGVSAACPAATSSPLMAEFRNQLDGARDGASAASIAHWTSRGGGSVTKVEWSSALSHFAAFVYLELARYAMVHQGAP